jgi:hypothetical protein
LRRAQSCGPALPVPSYPRPNAVPHSWRAQPRRAEGYVAMMAAASARLLNAFANQVETLRRLRVERIEVSDSAQAIISNINSQRHEV